MEPTKEQIKWFWKQCGIKYMGGDWCYAPDRIRYLRRPPPIDLNNLFKYAVPKLEECHLITFRQNEYYSIAKLNGKVVDATDKDPAPALFEAIYKAFGGDNG